MKNVAPPVASSGMALVSQYDARDTRTSSNTSLPVYLLLCVAKL